MNPKEPRLRTTRKGGAIAIENARLKPVGFDYDEIDRTCDGTPPPDPTDLAGILRSAIEWILMGEGKAFDKRAASNRLIAMGWYLESSCFTHDNVADLASSFGLTPEGLNKYVRSLNRRFGLYAPGQKHSMRSRDRQRANEGSTRVRTSKVMGVFGPN